MIIITVQSIQHNTTKTTQHITTHHNTTQCVKCIAVESNRRSDVMSWNTSLHLIERHLMAFQLFISLHILQHNITSFLISSLLISSHLISSYFMSSFNIISHHRKNHSNYLQIVFKLSSNYLQIILDTWWSSSNELSTHSFHSTHHEISRVEFTCS